MIKKTIVALIDLGLSMVKSKADPERETDRQTD